MAALLSLVSPVHTLVHTAHAHACHGLYDRALRELGDALQEAPESAPVWLEIGQTHALRGAYEEALEAYDQAIDLEPRYAEAHFRRGVVLGRLGRRREARESLATSVALCPEMETAVEAELARETLAYL